MNDLRITASDLPSLFGRSGLIGVEGFLNDFFTTNRTTNYPPYNIEALSANDYRITIAVAGFSREELEVTIDNGLLTIKGTKAEVATTEDEEKAKSDYPIVLHSGIARRDFTRSFKLVDYVSVSDVKLADGLLTIDLKRELPEAKKPKTLLIG